MNSAKDHSSTLTEPVEPNTLGGHMARLRSTILTTIIAVALTAGDLVAKWVALQTLPQGRVLLFPGVGTFIPSDLLGLMLHKNEGVIANIPLPLWLVIPFTILFLVGASAWVKDAVRRNHHSLVNGLILLSAGALGNLVDRIAHNFTTDYILLFDRSVVNIADGLIVVGLLWTLIAVRKRPIKQHAS